VRDARDDVVLSDVGRSPQFAKMSDPEGHGEEVSWFQDRSITTGPPTGRFAFTLNRPLGGMPERLTIADLTAVIPADLEANSLDTLDEGASHGEWMGAALRVRGLELRPTTTVIGLALSPLPKGMDVIGVDYVSLEGPNAEMEPEILYPAPDGSGGTIVGFDARSGTPRVGRFGVRAEGVAILLDDPISLDLSSC
jgi:hypothetical protein